MFKKYLCLSLFVSVGASAQTCKAYIENEWMDARYTVTTLNGQTTVTDAETNLMWKQCAEGLSGLSCDQGNVEQVNWIDALDAPQANTGFAGHQDWRLPNINELTSLVAYNCSNPSINDQVFPNTFPSALTYWSSTPKNSPNAVRSIYFYDGVEVGSTQPSMNAIRLVRTASNDGGGQ